MVGKRKIITGVVLLITGLAVTFLKGDIPNNLLSLMELLYGAFIFGNMGEHYTEVLKVTKRENKK